MPQILLLNLLFQFTSCSHWRPNGHSQGKFLKSFQSSTPLALKSHRNLSKFITIQSPDSGDILQDFLQFPVKSQQVKFFHVKLTRFFGGQKQKQF